MLLQNFMAAGLAVLFFALLEHEAVVADDNGPSHLNNETLVVARIGNSNTFAAYSKHSGKWLTHTFAEGITAIPVMGESLVAFQVTGDKVTELVAIDRDGIWRTQKLPKTGSRTCTPIVGSDVAAFSIDGTAYAFSGIGGSWASTALPATPQIASDYAMVVSDDRIAVFSAHTGSWAKSPVLTAPK